MPCAPTTRVSLLAIHPQSPIDAIISLIQDMQRVLVTAEDECPLHLVETSNRKGKVTKRMCFNDQYAAGRLFLSDRDKYNMSLDTEARLFVPTWKCPDLPNPCGNATVTFDPEKLMQTVEGRLHMVDLKRTGETGPSLPTLPTSIHTLLSIPTIRLQTIASLVPMCQRPSIPPQASQHLTSFHGRHFAPPYRPTALPPYRPVHHSAAPPAGEFRDNVLVTTPSIVHFNGGRQKAKQKTFLERRKIKFARDLSTFPVYIDKVGFKTYAELGCQPTENDPWPLKAPVPSQPISRGEMGVRGEGGGMGGARGRSRDGSAARRTTRTAVLFKIHELDKETNRALAQLKHDLGPASQVGI